MRVPTTAIGWNGLLALSATAQAVSASSDTGTVEVDLLFPHNDTYAPEPIIPIAFAVQNPEVAMSMQPSISFTVMPYGKNSSEPTAQGFYDFSGSSFNGTEPLIQYGNAVGTLNTEGTWQLEWTLSYANCSDDAAGRYSRKHRLVFTTKQDAKGPDLAAATTEKDVCSNGQGVAFKVTGTTESDDNENCPLLAQDIPSPTPCNVEIGSSAAASVSSSMTMKACAVQTESWCPKPTDSAADSTVIPRMAVGCMALVATAFGIGLASL